MISVSDNPIAIDVDGRATCVPALGVWFHLERLTRADAPRLDEVSERILAWFGDRLRWTFSSFDPEVASFRPEILDYVSGYAGALPEGTTPYDAITANFASFARADFSVHCMGSDDEGTASPLSVRFFAEIPDFEVRPIEVYPVLGMTVPLDWPVEDFQARVIDIAKCLRLRWGAAGLTYSRWTVAGVTEVENALAAHARRYIGFDAGIFVRQTKSLYDRIRTVNWLTLVGPVLAKGMELRVVPDIRVSTHGDVTVVRAGESPAVGDMNRLDVPRAYVEADKMFRRVRATQLRAGAVPGPWDDDSLSKWLRRFELAYN